jgi:hypothetical protein
LSLDEETKKSIGNQISPSFGLKKQNKTSEPHESVIGLK